MVTSPYDKMREAFAAGFAAADPERARLRGFESGAKAERKRSDVLVWQAQDYAREQTERAGKLAALALKMLIRCHALERGDDIAYLSEWTMALGQLDSAAGHMSPPDSDPLEEANQAGIKAERERIISLASQLRASFPADHPAGAQASFADYLRVTSAVQPEGGQ
jgi:hypothetical protein